MEKKENLNIKENSPLGSILGLITFSTILPLKVNVPLENMTRMLWIWPVIHFFVGILGFITAFICVDILHLPNLLTGAITYAFFLIFTGFHHIDGLMDMSDGVMVHGDAYRKIAVMKDSMVGAGGIVSFFIVGIITILALTASLDYNFMVAIIVAEMSSKISLLTTCITSNSHTQGSGVYFVNAVNIINFSISLIIVLVIAFIIAGPVGLIGVIGGVLAGALISIIARKNFKIANGDVLGASNEFGRMLSLLLMVISLTVII